MEIDYQQIKSVVFPDIGAGMVHCSREIGWISNEDSLGIHQPPMKRGVVVFLGMVNVR